MPKIIESLRENILSESRRVLFESGYGALSIRKIAVSCNVAVGTIYNYFENKDTIVANIMSEDWQKSLKEMAEKCELAQTAGEGFCAVFYALREYEELYRPVFAQYSGTGDALEIYGGRHRLLIGQIQKLLEKFLIRLGYAPDSLTAVAVEAILACAMHSEYGADSVTLLAERLYPTANK